MNIRIIASGLVIALVLITGIASALSNSGGGDWKYCREITVKENSGNALNDYQILVELNPSNFPDDTKYDGSDLRFAEDGKELSYWIEDYNTGAKTAKIWVKVSSIPAKGEAKIKMYYGNEKASSVSDGDATFEFFDDFEDGTYTDKWLRSRNDPDGYGKPQSGGDWLEADGKITASNCCQNSGICSQGPAILVSKSDLSISTDGFILDVTKSIATKSAGHSLISTYLVGTGMYGNPIGSWDRHFGLYVNTYSGGKVDILYPSEYNAVTHRRSTPLNVPIRYVAKYDGSSGWSITIYDGNGGAVYSADDTVSYSDTATLKVMLYVESPGSYYEEVKVSKYTSPEPTVSISAEFLTQKAPSLTLTKSAAPSTIQEGETTTISIRVENTGTGDAKAIEVTDAIPIGFKIISGSKSESFDKIKPGDYRTFEYTLKATGSGKFTCDPATITYKDADGNSYSAASNSVSIQVGRGGEVEVPVGTDSDGDGWSDEKEREMGTNPYSVDSDGDGLKDPEDPNPTVPEKKMPGFEIVFAIVGLLAVAYILRRRG